jgi:hypothetical protein
MSTRNELTNRFAGVSMNYSKNYAALISPQGISRVPAPLTTPALFGHW